RAAAPAGRERGRDGGQGGEEKKDANSAQGRGPPGWSGQASIVGQSDHGEGSRRTRAGVSVVTLRATGRGKAPRKTRITPEAISQRLRVRWPRMPIPKPLSMIAT